MQIQTLDGLLRAIFCLSIFGGLVIIGEYLKKQKVISGEIARKFTHTTTGTWAALWPLFLDLNSIATLSALLTIFAVASRFFLPLRSIYSVKRISIGEILIGIGISIAAILATSGSVYAAAVLVIAWSDSVAAVIGTLFGSKNSFKILGSKKSHAGSWAFMLTAAAIIFGFFLYENNSLISAGSYEVLQFAMYSIGIATALTVMELFGVYGIDNLSLPIAVALLLNLT